MGHAVNQFKNNMLVYALVFIAQILPASAFAADSKKISTKCSELLRVSQEHEVIGSDTAYDQANKLKEANLREKYLADSTPKSTISYGTDIPIVHSLEKEGLYYKDIAEWFSVLRPEAKVKLEKIFSEEKLKSSRMAKLTNWLAGLSLSSKLVSQEDIAAWKAKTPEMRLTYLLAVENPFSILTVKQASQLFSNEILDFYDITSGDNVPPHAVIGDDLGSYEVRMDHGIIDRTEYNTLRAQIEQYLKSSIGHQHLFHAWPTDSKAREKIAPYYIELLDATTWYLFWRQMKRDPETVTSLLAHKYLGVYTRDSLDRLYRAVVDNRVESFNDKFRMMGARNFKAVPEVPEQGEGSVPDWELRSGNKSVKREFIETMLEARLSSGDYSGLRDYRITAFDPSTEIEELAAPFLTEQEIAVLKKFQEVHPLLEYNPHKLAKNHFRNRILSPLLPWSEKFPMGLKDELLKDEQQKYAKGLVDIAKKFIKKLEGKEYYSPVALGDLRKATLHEMEDLMFTFAAHMRLDMDIERYLKIAPTKVPDITIPSSGPIDVNQIPIGIEYSHRFPIEARPRSRDQASEYLQKLAEQLRKAIGSNEPVASANNDSHGHGAVVKYTVADTNGDQWRVEWDGISRYYVEGKMRRAWGGHAEIPSPKMSPQNIESGIRQMFQAARSLGMFPVRKAGGGHFNIDLEQLQQNLSPESGARAIANLISYFESNEELMLFMWMHPSRKHAALPVDLQPGFAEKLNAFKGNWEDLGRLLYEDRYFNINRGRKPKYVPLNVTPIMTEILPDEYLEKKLDIRNPTQAWFPNFGKVTGRIEARFFDAPLDENMAALQIKYVRAILNRTINSQNMVIPLIKKYSAADFERWKKNPDQWLSEANAHLRELGLNPEEFKWLLWDSYQNRIRYEERQHNYKKYDRFLPAKPPKNPDQSRSNRNLFYDVDDEFIRIAA